MMKISMQKQNVHTREDRGNIAFYYHSSEGPSSHFSSFKVQIYRFDKFLRQKFNKNLLLVVPFGVGLLAFILLLGTAYPLIYPERNFQWIKRHFCFPKDVQLDSYLLHHGQLDKILFSDEARLSETSSPNSTKLKTVIHTVQSGESLSSLAHRYNLTFSTLINFNDITNARRMRAGAELIIPNADGVLYTVRKGDSLSSLIQKHKIPQEKLLEVNGLTSPLLTLGQKIFLPGVSLSNWEVRQAIGELFIYPARGYMSSHFGYRRDPFTGIRSFHNGIDIANAKGTPIKAAMEGRVAYLGFHPSYGNYIIINHSGSFRTLYAHLSSFSIKQGSYVNQGQVLGRMGSTGYSTGTHLHFCIFKGNRPYNPLRYLY